MKRGRKKKVVMTVSQRMSQSESIFPVLKVRAKTKIRDCKLCRKRLSAYNPTNRCFHHGTAANTITTTGREKKSREIF